MHGRQHVDRPPGDQVVPERGDEHADHRDDPVAESRREPAADHRADRQGDEEPGQQEHRVGLVHLQDALPEQLDIDKGHHQGGAGCQ
ncbi:Uncharacterised protein [Mycobacteroides abscessus subsp. abscessus]|nr:Uncharacterised protein [Mycobacteroides abscessus subsp. abscessus]